MLTLKVRGLQQGAIRHHIDPGRHIHGYAVNTRAEMFKVARPPYPAAAIFLFFGTHLNVT